MHVDYNKVYACYGVKISKNTSVKIFKQGACARRAGTESAFVTLMLYMYHSKYLLMRYLEKICLKTKSILLFYESISML